MNKKLILTFLLGSIIVVILSFDYLQVSKEEFNKQSGLVIQDFSHQDQTAAVADFGLNNSSGGLTGSNGRMTCSGPYSPSSSGTLNSISAYLSASSGQVGFAIYSDNGLGTAPASLLASDNGQPANLTASPSWVSSNVSYPVVAGTNYWLCYFPSVNPMTYYYKGVSGFHIIFSSTIYTSFGNWPNIFSKNSDSAGRQQMIYGTYASDSSAPIGDTQALPNPQPDIIPTAISNNTTLVTPHLLVADPAKNWYGGPNDRLGYDILNLALSRDVNITDKVMVQWSSNGNTWTGNTNTYAANIFISVPALPYNIKEYYRIRAISGTSGNYQYSDWSNVLPVVSLYPPDTFSAVAKSRTSVYLTWAYRGAKDQSGQEYELLTGSGYKIERSTDPNFPAGNTQIITVSQPYTLIPNPNNTTKKLVAYTDNGTFTNDTYYYRVRAFTNIGDGETSKVVSLAPNRLPDPVDYSATYMMSDSSTAVAIPFNTNTKGQTGYRIDRSDDSISWTTIKSSSSILSSNPYVDRGLTPGRTYYYRVVAINDVGDSPYNLLKVDVPNSAPANTTQWYVDNNSVTGGSNNGTSWTNAWHNFSSINWYAIKPGDSIYISGGASGQIYTEALYVMKGGIEGNPVTIKVGNGSSHHGKITLKNGIIFRAPWITLDGAKDPFFNFSNLENIVSNQNIEVQNPNDYPCIYSSSPEGTRILWIDINGCGSLSGIATSRGNIAAVLFNGNSGVGIRGSEIAYNRAYDIFGTGLSVSGPADTYGLSAIHHNIIERTRNDFILGSGGLDIYNNIARNWVGPGIGHPDGFQISAPYTRIYNNIIHDTPGMPIYIGLYTPDAGHIQIFNNIIYPTQVFNHSSIVFTEGNQTFMPMITMSDVLIANNLVYNVDWSNLVIGEHPVVGTLKIRNMVVRNNIFYRPSNTLANGGFISLKDYGYYDFMPEDIIFDNNIVAGGRVLSITLKDVTYPTPEDFNNAITYNGVHPTNTSALPQMVNPSGFDFRLSLTDNTAKNKGTDLSLYCIAAYGWNQSNCPLTKDIAGNARQPGAWDIGPYEYVGGGVVQPPITTPTTPTTPTSPIIGDFNNDGLVNSIDLSLMITAWNTSNTTYDLNRDGAVNSLDYVMMVRNWTV